MSRIIRCDRCGAVIPAEIKKVGNISLRYLEPWTDMVVERITFDFNDYCPECMEKIRKFIEGKAEEETMEQPAAEKDIREEITDSIMTMIEKNEAEKKAAEKEKPNEIDYLVLRNMVLEGKKAQEIADYFGISLGAFYKHRKKAENLYNKGEL